MTSFLVWPSAASATSPWSQLSLEEHFVRSRRIASEETLSIAAAAGGRSRVAALSEVSFTIARRECVAVLGQNGSGKSTLVRTLSTLLLPDGGRAEVFGHDVVRDAGAVRRLVNRVSVEASFFKRMSAVENLSYSARFYGLTPSVTRGRIPEILDTSASRSLAPPSRWRTSRAACSRRWRSHARS